MKPGPEFKKRKVDGASSATFGRTCSAPQDDDRDSAENLRENLRVPGAQTGSVNLMIQPAKHFAVTQAQEECCTGNFRIFDSPFGNFLVPVIPTREELSTQQIAP